MTDISEIIARWKSGEGRPFKGRLIDLDAYNDDPSNLGCMCAQGQVLYLLGGVDVRQLVAMKPAESDRETAELLGISRAHAALLRIINDRRDGCPEAVIENPEAILGDQWRTVLAFWRHVDRMTLKQWVTAGEAAWASARGAAGAMAWASARGAAIDAAGHAAGVAAGEAARAAAGDAARAVARAAAWAAARDAAGEEAWAAAMNAAGEEAWAAAWAPAKAAAMDAAMDAAWCSAEATNEIQGAAVMRKRGHPFYFLPLFGFADPEAVLASDGAG